MENAGEWLQTKGVRGRKLFSLPKTNKQTKRTITKTLYRLKASSSNFVHMRTYTYMAVQLIAPQQTSRVCLVSETTLPGLFREKWDERLSARKVQSSAWLSHLMKYLLTAFKVLDLSVTNGQFLLLVVLALHGTEQVPGACAQGQPWALGWGWAPAAPVAADFALQLPPQRTPAAETGPPGKGGLSVLQRGGLCLLQLTVPQGLVGIPQPRNNLFHM